MRRDAGGQGPARKKRAGKGPIPKSFRRRLVERREAPLPSVNGERNASQAFRQTDRKVRRGASQALGASRKSGLPDLRT